MISFLLSFLVSGLASESFTTRQLAHRSLESAGRSPAVIPHLVEGTRSDDLEVRARCRTLLKHAVREQYAHGVPEVWWFIPECDLSYAEPILVGVCAAYGVSPYSTEWPRAITTCDQDSARHAAEEYVFKLFLAGYSHHCVRELLEAARARRAAAPAMDPVPPDPPY